MKWVKYGADGKLKRVGALRKYGLLDSSAETWPSRDIAPEANYVATRTARATGRGAGLLVSA